MTSTNRFNLLMKDNTSDKIPNTNRNNKMENVSNNFKTNRFINKQVNNEREKKQKEETFIKSLDSLTEFPELQVKNTNNFNTNKQYEKEKSSTFIDIMKNYDLKKNKMNTDTDENNCLENVPDGCVCIKYDKETKQPLWIYGKNSSPVVPEKDSSEEEQPFIVFQRLVNLHLKRKYEYIRKWGIDEYDKMFMFQNYDYEYFDKIDDQIVNEMEKCYQNRTHNNTNYYIDEDVEN